MIQDEEGNWITEQSNLKQEFLRYFKDIFIPSDQREPIDTSDGLLANLSILSEAHCNILNAPFTKDEIKMAAFSPKPFKSPGPDGFPPAFFQKEWSSVEKNFYRSDAQLHHLKPPSKRNKQNLYLPSSKN